MRQHPHARSAHTEPQGFTAHQLASAAFKAAAMAPTVFDALDIVGDALRAVSRLQSSKGAGHAE